MNSLHGFAATENGAVVRPAVHRIAFCRRFTRWRMTVLALAVSLTLSGCVYLPQPALPDPSTLTAEQRADQNERVYETAWNLVHRGYFSETYNNVDWSKTREKYLEAARAAQDDTELYRTINTMLAELEDDHTHALSARVAEELFRHERVLLGLLLQPQNTSVSSGPMVVAGTMPGSTAAESGVRPGWVLLACDGLAPRDVLGLGHLREEQVVHCLFRDFDNQEREIPLVARRLSTSPTLSTRVMDDGIVVLRFDKFDSGSARWLRGELKAHANAPGIVVDLRFNPGGDAAALGRMLGEFFDRRVDMGTFITRRGINDELRAWRWIGSAHYKGRVAVLISGASASSAEIFAAVMQHHGRARIFGERSGGVVLASRFFPLPGGGRLQLSIDDYIGPDGQRLEGRGVTPDEIVIPTPQDFRIGRDAAFEAALRSLRSAAK